MRVGAGDTRRGLRPGLSPRSQTPAAPGPHARVSLGQSNIVAKTKIGPKLQEWIAARKRFRLSHAHVQMAREVGLNPAKLGSIANHRQEPWKAPLPDFIEQLYEQRFGKSRPDTVMTIEQVAECLHQKKAERREARKARREVQGNDAGSPAAAAPDGEAQSG
jgi:hypothetical protein